MDIYLVFVTVFFSWRGVSLRVKARAVDERYELFFHVFCYAEQESATPRLTPRRRLTHVHRRFVLYVGTMVQQHDRPGSDESVQSVSSPHWSAWSVVDTDSYCYSTLTAQYVPLAAWHRAMCIPH